MTVAIRRVLIANRGEIALRIIHAAQALGMETVLATSQADRDSLPARMADRALCIGPAQSSESYLKIDALLTAALESGCDALHPGYGFLAESEQLAEACAREGIIFVGPTPDQILRMGNKLEARALARQAGVPMLPGSEKVNDFEQAMTIADGIGYPVMLKAAAGGGGHVCLHHAGGPVLCGGRGHRLSVRDHDLDQSPRLGIRRLLQIGRAHV